MSTKPTDIPRFAATSPGVITGSIIAPSPAKMTVGFVTRERIPAQILSWLLYTLYTWVQYLADGAFQGPASFDSSVSIAGALTAGSVNISNLTANVLTVTGSSTLAATTTTTLAASSTLSAPSILGGAIAATGTITGNRLATSSDIVMPVRTVTIASSAFRPQGIGGGAAPSTTYAYEPFTTAGGRVYNGWALDNVGELDTSLVQLVPGDRITGIVVFTATNGSGGTGVVVKLISETTSTGRTTQFTGTGAACTAVNTQTDVYGSVNQTLGVGEAWTLSITAAAPASTHAVFVKVLVDHP